MLLNDEDAGADPADGELLVALYLRRLHLDRLDPGRRRPLSQEPDQFVDGRRRALGMNRHGAVVGVPNPAENAELTRSRTVASRKPTPWTAPRAVTRAAVAFSVIEPKLAKS